MATTVKVSFYVETEIEIPTDELDEAYDQAEAEIVEQTKNLGWGKPDISSLEYVLPDGCDSRSDRAYEEQRDRRIYA